VAPTFEGGEDVADIIRLATACGVRVACCPRLLEVIGHSVEFDDLGGQVMLGMRASAVALVARPEAGFRPGGRIGAVIALAPLMLLIALAVKLSSHGPVLFRQISGWGATGNEFKAPQVPHDGQRRRAAQARADRAERGGADVQDRRRPAHNADRPAAGAAARSTSFRALQRAARRHEPRRPRR